ncbi:MAG: VOC family protein [Thermoleophilia bacterium]|nr:VOC family protein [Thermoleophilia bacterium]
MLYSADVDRAARFYEDAFGFERTYRWPAEGERLDYAALRRADSHLGIGLGEGSGGFELCVYVEDVDATAERLRALGAREIAAPADQSWGERLAYFEDPDGHRLHVTMKL